ncbi:unnamed protein product [Paramecium sonneborni]|uniref:Uncharacterized protein n=1 Tax=Paramecium sonneborni TaxID=65129 RepID=A0A8S1N307_9CILI|nr:unnamed protein product [Paramecium sonneborni]
MTALHYIFFINNQQVKIMIRQMSFTMIFYELRYFIQDDDARFREYLKFKREFRDTSQLGITDKDLVYQNGAIQILKYRSKIKFNSFAKQQQRIVFVQEKLDKYLQRISIFHLCYQNLINSVIEFRQFCMIIEKQIIKYQNNLRS